MGTTKKAAPKKEAAKKKASKKKVQSAAGSEHNPNPGSLGHNLEGQAWERGEGVQCEPDESE